jgi:hypothetical protein
MQKKVIIDNSSVQLTVFLDQTGLVNEIADAIPFLNTKLKKAEESHLQKINDVYTYLEAQVEKVDNIPQEMMSELFFFPRELKPRFVSNLVQRFIKEKKLELSFESVKEVNKTGAFMQIAWAERIFGADEADFYDRAENTRMDCFIGDSSPSKVVMHKINSPYKKKEIFLGDHDLKAFNKLPLTEDVSQLMKFLYLIKKLKVISFFTSSGRDVEKFIEDIKRLKRALKSIGNTIHIEL